ncbi:Protein kinase superfamily protein [Rhynchospora pubera]|uniref:Protein kinase superfamily protein n=1 Tax=Rhynchospora pubera TaxID=906938 RepID=A0AAV8FXV0_9POAL|nr:Protein kinase superfamily protein [Rhynchospora pubera]KAJ4796900.1 Protein kinase superfamily protein [Rhynchospora pubera]
MEEQLKDNNSWLRRTRYSKSVCHRLLPSQIPDIDFAVPEPRSKDIKLRASVSMRVTPDGASKHKISDRESTSKLNLKFNSHRDYNCEVQKDSDSMTRKSGSSFKFRPPSPIPSTIISDVFREAKETARRRFATPPPRERKGMGTVKPPTMPKKESSWSKKYLDHGVSRVSALETTCSEVNFSVDMSKLYVGKKFASGAHSRLFRGIYNEEEVAVKIIRCPQSDDGENGEMAAMLEKQYEREVACLSHLCHCNVIKLLGATKNPPVFCIITEYLAGGSLRSFLHKQNHTSLPLPELLSIALGVARGMEYIHSQGMVHRDLKPENILLDRSGDSAGINVKIADFGISCEERLCEVVSEEDSGTYRWMAPEMVRRQPYCRKVDVYSFGLLLWEMVSGRMPFEDMTPIQAAFAVVDKNLRPAVPTDCPVALRALIEQCWALRPDKRPEFWQIVKILEQFQLSLSETGSLDSVKHVTCLDQKNWLYKLIHMLKPSSNVAGSS